MTHLSDPDRLERLARYVLDEPQHTTPTEVADALVDAARRIRSSQERERRAALDATIEEAEAVAVRVALAECEDYAAALSRGLAKKNEEVDRLRELVDHCRAAHAHVADAHAHAPPPPPPPPPAGRPDTGGGELARPRDGIAAHQTGGSVARGQSKVWGEGDRP